VTAALLGSSGLGKSTLANHLLGEARTKTSAARR
jgi:putative ribosome biogenesis GTPase RsgA